MDAQMVEPAAQMAEQVEHTSGPPASLDRDRLAQLAGSGLVRSAVPGLQTESLFARTHADGSAVTCPTSLSNRQNLIYTGAPVGQQDKDKASSEGKAYKCHRLTRLTHILDPNPKRQSMNLDRERLVSQSMAFSDRPQGHRRMNQYTNYAIQLDRKDIRLQHPADDVHYKGILLADIPGDQICTKYIIHPYNAILPSSIWSTRQDGHCVPLCGKPTCWLCSAHTLGRDFLDQATYPDENLIGAHHTIGTALRTWLKMINYTFHDADHEALPLKRRWGGLDQSGMHHLDNLIHTSWVHWHACYLIGETNYRHFVKLGGVRLPHWTLLDSRDDLPYLATHIELYRRDPIHEDDPGYYAKLQVTKEIRDEVYAALWNLTLAEPHAEHHGPILTNFEKANAIDMLIGLGRALRFITPQTREALYSEIGNLEEMSFFWEILLSKVSEPEYLGLPRFSALSDPRDIDSEVPDTTEETNWNNWNHVFDGTGNRVYVAKDHPLFQTPHMAWAIVSSESRYF